MHVHLARKRGQSEMDHSPSFVPIYESGNTKCYFYKARLFSSVFFLLRPPHLTTCSPNSGMVSSWESNNNDRRTSNTSRKRCIYDVAEDGQLPLISIVLKTNTLITLELDQ